MPEFIEIVSCPIRPAACPTAVPTANPFFRFNSSVSAVVPVQSAFIEKARNYATVSGQLDREVSTATEDNLLSPLGHPHNLYSQGRSDIPLRARGSSSAAAK
jgi:hypothetical protein